LVQMVLTHRGLLGSIGKEMGTVLHFRTIRLQSRGFKQI
jgi:hypothetical protein